MLKNALVYRVDHWDVPAVADLEARLAGARFVACGASQAESVGFVEPRGEKGAALVEAVAGQLLVALCTETKAVPGGVVKAELDARLDAVEAETGRRPKGKRARELKEEIVRELLPRAFPKRGRTLVWLAPRDGLMVVGVASAKRADRIVSQLVESLGGGLRVTQMQTRQAAATAMSAWLSDKEAPPGFTVDRDCELKAPDSEKATVRYARHTLDIDEVGEHIRQGKVPTRLALTWEGRVSFVLTDQGALKNIALLDVVLEGRERQAAPDDEFDADVALTTGELRGLIGDLVGALGGWLEPGGAAVPPAPAGELAAVAG